MSAEVVQETAPLYLRLAAVVQETVVTWATQAKAVPLIFWVMLRLSLMRNQLCLSLDPTDYYSYTTPIPLSMWPDTIQRIWVNNKCGPDDETNHHLFLRKTVISKSAVQVRVTGLSDSCCNLRIFPSPRIIFPPPAQVYRKSGGVLNHSRLSSLKT